MEDDLNFLKIEEGLIIWLIRDNLIFWIKCKTTSLFLEGNLKNKK